MRSIIVDENDNHVKQLFLGNYFFLQQPSLPFYLQAFKSPGSIEPCSSISVQLVMLLGYVTLFGRQRDLIHSCSFTSKWVKLKVKKRFRVF